MEIEWVQCREREPTNLLVRIEGKGHRQRRKVLLQAMESLTLRSYSPMESLAPTEPRNEAKETKQLYTSRTDPGSGGAQCQKGSEH